MSSSNTISVVRDSSFSDFLISYFSPVSKPLVLLGQKKKKRNRERKFLVFYYFWLTRDLIVQIEKAQLIRSLQTHKVNTMTELRRIEKIFEGANSAETVDPMSSAWSHYVNSHQLLSELRALTKNYPFSSECLDEAKCLAIEDSANNRSRNFCWLVLSKIRKEYVTLPFFTRVFIFGLFLFFFSSFPKTPFRFFPCGFL